MQARSNRRAPSGSVRVYLMLAGACFVLAWLFWPASRSQAPDPVAGVNDPSGLPSARLPLACQGWPELLLEPGALDALDVATWEKVVQGDVLGMVRNQPHTPHALPAPRALWWRSGYELAALVLEASRLGNTAVLLGQQPPTRASQLDSGAVGRSSAVVPPKLALAEAMGWLFHVLLAGRALTDADGALLGDAVALEASLHNQGTLPTQAQGLAQALKETLTGEAIRVKEMAQHGPSPLRALVGQETLVRLLPRWLALVKDVGCPYQTVGITRIEQALRWAEMPETAPPVQTWAKTLSLVDPTYDSRGCPLPGQSEGIVKHEALILAVVATVALARLEKVPDADLEGETFARLYRSWAASERAPSDPERGVQAFCGQEATHREGLKRMGPEKQREALAFGDFLTSDALADELFRRCHALPPCGTWAPERAGPVEVTDQDAQERLEAVETWEQGCLDALSARQPEVGTILRNAHALSGLARMQLVGRPARAEEAQLAGCNLAGLNERYAFWGGTLGQGDRWGLEVHRLAWSELRLLQGHVGDAAKPVCDLALGRTLFVSVCELVRSIPTGLGQGGGPNQ